MTSPALIFIHNHRFEGNIERLEQLYGGRFSQIHHVMPFYSGTKRNVHRGYESSHHFQGLFAQATEQLLELDAPHYIFCGDDLILNPRLDESNILPALLLGPEDAYIKGINSLADVPFSWPHRAGALLAFAQNNGVEWRRELPSREEAEGRFAMHLLPVGRMDWRTLRHGIGGRQLAQTIHYLLKRLQAGDKARAFREMPYPLANSYADFFVIPRRSVRTFCHLCGVFAAMNLFAEVAIPTAMILSCDRIVQEPETALRGVELWTPAEVSELTARYGSDLQKLLESFPAEQLYVHPVKLSRWNIPQR